MGDPTAADPHEYRVLSRETVHEGRVISLELDGS